jgi:biofilm PGA synthesis N-glycosyltransferase PgaC
MKVLFWSSVFVIFYTFLGYGILLYLLVRVRRLLVGDRKKSTGELPLPTLTLVVAAYNEAEILEEKIKNTLSLNYPADKLQLLFVTDGSTDASPEIIGQYSQIKGMFSPERRGKIHAIHRAMAEVTSDIVVFTDANTFLNPDALELIARCYEDPKVGAVSGEKRVEIDGDDAASNEGIYWKYESTLKKWDSELYSVVGAAGELFSVRRCLYEPVSSDTILDDFMISMLIAQKGYRIVYEPKSYAVELSSANVSEELKRKVRIAAGGIQSILRLEKLFNPFLNPVLSFQYISHRVLRWTVTPFLMIMCLLVNAWIWVESQEVLYGILLVGQVLFYSAALFGWYLDWKEAKSRIFFVPYYFCMMNYAVLAGIGRYIRGSQSAVWVKSQRRK